MCVECPGGQAIRRACRGVSPGGFDDWEITAAKRQALTAELTGW